MLEEISLSQQAINIENTPVLPIRLLGERFTNLFARRLAERFSEKRIEKGRMTLISTMIAFYEGYRDSEKGWIDRLIYYIHGMPEGTLIVRLNNNLSLFFTQDRPMITNNPTFDSDDSYLFNVFALCGFYGSEGRQQGAIVRWAQTLELNQRQRINRTNLVVELISMVVLRLQLRHFVDQTPEYLNGVKDTLKTLMGTADDVRKTLAYFAIRLIDTELSKSDTLL